MKSAVAPACTAGVQRKGMAEAVVDSILIIHQ